MNQKLFKFVFLNKKFRTITFQTKNEHQMKCFNFHFLKKKQRAMASRPTASCLERACLMGIMYGVRFRSFFKMLWTVLFFKPKVCERRRHDKRGFAATDLSTRSIFSSTLVDFLRPVLDNLDMATPPSLMNFSTT